MADGNFSNIEGFNDGPRREHPGLRAAVASVLAGAIFLAVWTAGPYAAALLMVVR